MKRHATTWTHRGYSLKWQCRWYNLYDPNADLVITVKTLREGVECIDELLNAGKTMVQDGMTYDAGTTGLFQCGKGHEWNALVSAVFTTSFGCPRCCPTCDSRGFILGIGGRVITCECMNEPGVERAILDGAKE